MSTLDRHIKHVAQQSLPDAMQQAFGMVEAAYTYVMGLSEVIPMDLDNSSELVQLASRIEHDLYEALAYGGKLLSVSSQFDHVPVTAERALRAIQQANSMLTEARSMLDGVVISNPSVQAVYDQFTNQIAKARGMMSELTSQLAA